MVRTTGRRHATGNPGPNPLPGHELRPGLGRTRTAALLGLTLLAATACIPEGERAPWPEQAIAWTDGTDTHVWWKGEATELPETNWIHGWLPQRPRFLYSTPEGFGVFDAERGETVAEYPCSCKALTGTDPDFPIVVHQYDRDEFVWLDQDLEPLAAVMATDVLPIHTPDPGIYPGDLHGPTLYLGYAEHFNERVLADGIYGLDPDGELTPVLPQAQEFPQGRMDLHVSPDGGTIAYVQRQDRSTCERWASITLLDAKGAERPQKIAPPAPLENRSTEIGQVRWEGDELYFTARESGFFGHLVMPCDDAMEPLRISSLYRAATDESEPLAEAVLMEQPLGEDGRVRLTAPEPGEEGPLLQVRRGEAWSTLAQRPGDVHVQPWSP